VTVLEQQPVDEALDAVGDLSTEVFSDLDIEATRSPAYTNEAVSDEHDRRLWRTLADTGLLAAVLPESVGGGGTGVLGMVRLLTGAGAALARVPLVETFVAVSVIEEKNLPAVMSGELVITAALAEHPSAIASPLRLNGNRLNGITQLVPYPLSADAVLVPAHVGHCVGQPDGDPDQGQHHEGDRGVHRHPVPVLGRVLRRAGIGRQILLCGGLAPAGRRPAGPEADDLTVLA